VAATRVFAEKVCKGCGAAYAPTSPNQKFCPPCGDVARGVYLKSHTRPPRKGQARDSWVREQEAHPCRRCGAEPGRQCTSASGTLARFPHQERYLDAGGEPGARKWPQQPQRAALKKRVFAHYGTACACCGSTHRLTIDHIDGSGKEHRAEIGNNGVSIYMWLVEHDFPPGFQTLCGPCNTSKSTGDHCRMHVAVCPSCHRPLEEGVIVRSWGSDRPPTIRPAA